MQRALSSGNKAVEWRFLGSKGTVVSLWAGIAGRNRPERARTLARFTRDCGQRRARPRARRRGQSHWAGVFLAKDKQPKVAKEEFGKLPHDQLLEQTLHRAFDLIEQSVSLIARKHA